MKLSPYEWGPWGGFGCPLKFGGSSRAILKLIFSYVGSNKGPVGVAQHGY